jgi:hypothetical protein
LSVADCNRKDPKMEGHTESLLDVAPGETVRVRQVVFDGLRAYCAELGVGKGDQLTLLESGRSDLLLEEADGRLVRCPCEYARFVEVDRCRSLRRPSHRPKSRRPGATGPRTRGRGNPEERRSR